MLSINDPNFVDWIPLVYKRLILPESMERGDFEFSTMNFPLLNENQYSTMELIFTNRIY